MRVHPAIAHRTCLRGVNCVTLRSDEHFPRHSHEQFGFGWMLSGGHLSASGMGNVQARAGDVILVNPGEVHDGAPLEGGVREWRMFYVDPSVVREMVGFEMEGLRPVAGDPVLARRLAGLFEGREEVRAEEELLLSLVRLARCHAAGAVPSLEGPRAMQRSRERIDDDPVTPVSLAELSRLEGVSRFQLVRAFAREVGLTPHAYQIERRVALARRLLRSGVRPAEAAVSAGFADQSHLTRAFRSRFGLTPARYQAAAAAISFKTAGRGSCDS